MSFSKGGEARQANLETYDTRLSYSYHKKNYINIPGRVDPNLFEDDTEASTNFQLQMIFEVLKVDVFSIKKRYIQDPVRHL